MAIPYRWVIVALGGLMGCVAIGAMFSLAVFLDPMAADTGWSRAGISTAMTIDFVIMGVAGFLWGMLSDRIGPRIVTLIGAILLGAGLLVASRATTPLGFQLGFGLLVGLAAGAFFAPMIAAVTGWFETRRALAVSLVSVGIGMAPITMTPFAGWLITHTDWRTALAAMGVIAWALLIPAAFFVRRPPASAPSRARHPPPTLGAALRSPQFAVLGEHFFLCCAAHAGPIFHTISYAKLCGISTMAAVSIYSVEGLAACSAVSSSASAPTAGAPSRCSSSASSCRRWPSRSTSGSAASAASMRSPLFFGMVYGGVMPLYAVLARDYFGQAVMGTVLGAATMLSSLGMALGPLGGGSIYDTFGSYAWLYAASGLLAAGAVAVSLAFPPVAGTERQPAAA